MPADQQGYDPATKRQPTFGYQQQQEPQGYVSPRPSSTDSNSSPNTLAMVHRRQATVSINSSHMWDLRRSYLQRTITISTSPISSITTIRLLGVLPLAVVAVGRWV